MESKNLGDSSEVISETCSTSPFIDRYRKKTSQKNFLKSERVKVSFKIYQTDQNRNDSDKVSVKSVQSLFIHGPINIVIQYNKFDALLHTSNPYPFVRKSIIVARSLCLFVA